MVEIVEVTYGGTLNCPICNKDIVKWDEYKDEEDSAQPCIHTLFIAFELGFEYCSSFMKNYLKSVIKSNEVILDDEYLKFEFFDNHNFGLDDLVDLEFGNLKIISVSTPPPHVETTFFGFISEESNAKN